MARKPRKPSRAERRCEYFEWQIAAAPNERARLWVAVQYFQAVLAGAEDPDQAAEVAARMTTTLLRTAQDVRAKEGR